MPFDSELNLLANESAFSRYMGPEHIASGDQISTRESIKKMLQGEGVLSPTETVLDEEAHTIEEVLRRVFDNLKTSILSCNSFPELDAMFKATLRVQQFPLPQLNRQSGEFDSLLNRHGQLEVSPDGAKLFRFLMTSELQYETLSPAMQQAWSEFEEVWHKIHAETPGMAVEGMAKKVGPFEAQQMNEVITFIKERAQAIGMIENARRRMIHDAEQAVEKLDQSPKLLEWELLEELMYKRLSGEWRKGDGDESRIEELKRGKDLQFLLTCFTEKMGDTMLMPNQLVSTHLVEAAREHILFKTPDPLFDNFTNMISGDNAAKDSESAKNQSAADALAEKHLKSGEYTLPDGSKWFYGINFGQRFLLPLEVYNKYKVAVGVNVDRTRWHFYHQAIENRVVSKTEKELTPKIKEAVVREAWSTLLNLSQKSTTEGLIQWLETETQRVETWVAADLIPDEIEQKLADTPRESLWQVETDKMQYRAILKGERSTLSASPTILEWQAVVRKMRKESTEKPNKLTLRYLKLMQLLREMLKYDIGELQSTLPADQHPELLTEELTNKMFEIAKGDRAPLVAPEWTAS
jgi:hypothetical protein